MKKILPFYITKYKFDQDKLNEVLVNGEPINENIDSTGNQIINTETNSISDNLIKVPQLKTEYSDDKISQNYMTEFSEFKIPEEQTESNLLVDDSFAEVDADQRVREGILENQLNELSKILELETQKSIKFQEDSEQNYKATKNLIVDMRIKNGEGDDYSDFQDSFPFLPKTKDSEPSYNPIPYVSNPE